MPASSPEAIARKQAKQSDRKKRQRRAASAEKRVEIKKSDLPRYKIAARRMMPRLPEMTKEQLREMLAQAARNTAAQSGGADA